MTGEPNIARKPSEHLSGAGVIVKALQDQGVEVIFGYPGGAVLPLYDELFNRPIVLSNLYVKIWKVSVHTTIPRR